MSTGIVLAHVTFALLLFLLLPSKRLGVNGRLILLCAAGAASFAVIDGLSLGDYTRSYTDDLAVTTLLWFSWCALSRVRGKNTLLATHKFQLAVCFAALTLFLYPATMGLSTIDPYRLGYSPAPLLATMGAICLWLWWQGNHLALGLITVATGAYLLDIKDSDNYWDYIIDPLLGLYCLVYLLRRLYRICRERLIPICEM